MLDWMHCKYIGSDQYMLGSVLWILCFLVLPGAAEDNVKTCWSFIKLYYKLHRTKVRYRFLNKLTMFTRKKDGPKLRGKASEVKYVIPAIVALWQKHMSRGVYVHRQILLMLKLNAKLESMLNQHVGSNKLPEPDATVFEQTAFAMARLQSEVARHYSGEAVKLFSITSKTHFVCHDAMLARHMNPKLVWCFGGEDYMHKSQKLAQSCTRGVSQTACTVKLASHYRVGLDLELQEME